MYEIVINTTEEKPVPVEELYNLRKASYQQWLDEGLTSPGVYEVTLKGFSQYLSDKVVFVAHDAVTGELLGMHNLKLNKRKGSAWGANLAIAPQVKHEGLASRMLQEEIRRLRQEGYRYFQGSTGIPAVWSVRWHLKNGYRIVGYSRGSGKNYPSYTFRKQIAYDFRHHPTDFLWLPFIAPVTARLSYAITFLATTICKKRSGELNGLGRFANRLRR